MKAPILFGGIGAAILVGDLLIFALLLVLLNRMPTTWKKSSQLVSALCKKRS